MVFVGRPAFGREGATIGIFKLTAGGDEAVRTPVTFGRISTTAIEVRSGLQPGDRVILSDTSQWDGYDRLRLN